VNRTGSDGRRQLAMTYESLCKFGGTGKCSVKKFSAVDAESKPPPLNDTRLAANATTMPTNRTLQGAAPSGQRNLNGMGNWCKWAGIGCTTQNQITPVNTTNRYLLVADAAAATAADAAAAAAAATPEEDQYDCHAEFAALETVLVELVSQVSSSCQALLQAPQRVQQCVVVVV
jgi:hypothetical protein